MTDRRAVSKLFADARRVDADYKKWKKRISRQGFTANGVSFLEEMKKNRDRLNEPVDPFRSGTPSAYYRDIVMRVNSLPMIYAGRWIVFSTPDFSLPQKMIADSAAFRERRKLQAD
jgi:hypothetical protein